MTFLENTVVKYLRETASKIEQGNCSLTEDEAVHIMSSIAHIELSKEQTCDYLNVKRNQLGNLISKGTVPKGRKVKGFKELRWYLNELVQVISLKNKKHT